MRLRRSAAGVAAVAVIVAVGVTACGVSTTSVTEPEFTNELAIPPLADSTVEGGVRTFDLAAQRGSTDFAGQDGPTETWGFNGAFLGPTLRAQRGEKIAVDVENDLTEPTSVHWHGMHLPSKMDGGPHQMIDPGQTWKPHWTIDQPAATLWYHPHPHGQTEDHVYKGLAGMVILDDDASQSADLPYEYGVDDLPLIVQDRTFSDGQLELTHDGAEPGMLGDTVMVNGTIGAVQEVTAEKVRLRLLNGSTARTYAFEFPDRTMDLIAGDGGFLDEPVEIDRLRLAPGERAEVVVDFAPGETVRMRSAEVDLGGVAVPATMGGHDSFDVLEFRAAEILTPAPEPAWSRSSHAEEDGLDEAEAATIRKFELEEREINGERMDMSRIDEVVHVGDTEVWVVRSKQPIPHSFHVHDVQFDVLSVDGEPPPVEMSGRKDTIYLEPNRDYRLLMRFEDYTDPHLPYMYHCHMLLHEDEGMMGQFVVIDPGQEGDVGMPAGHEGVGHEH
ncbi:multicopper oxidase family protein [Brevibacterium limosum]|uniref:multicopper oxidase family protein n=1 Tax=Brevibacterium limosum TaxID=2697565 RepID=UPI00141E0F45|nr:multicopper oxidase domain-containing protein [Brevibacterium limosum]